MNELLVAVFDTEDAAVKGMRTLTDLHQEGGISLYASALIVRAKDGKISVKQPSDPTPLGAALGLLTGGIVGILGGPAGSAVGASLGGYVGLLVDWAHSGIDLKFLDDVGKTLSPGKAAVLAEIEESWTSLLEPRLREQDGIVFRRFRTDVVEDQLLQESKALRQQLEVLEDDIASANAVNKEALQKSIRSVKQRLETIRDRAKAAIDRRKAETGMKVNVLRRQAEAAAEDAKTRIQKRIADMEADFEMRSKNLAQARDRAIESVKRIRREKSVSSNPLAVYGLAGFWPQAERRTHETIIAVNFGGCIVPVGLALYEIGYLAISNPRALMLCAAGCLVNIAVCYFVARPVAGIGITMPALVSPTIAVLFALLLTPDAAPPVAFVIGVLGPLIGADLLHLKDIEAAETGVASVGGAGTFDGIVLSGIIAAYLA